MVDEVTAKLVCSKICCLPIIMFIQVIISIQCTIRESGDIMILLSSRNQTYCNFSTTKSIKCNSTQIENSL